MKAIVNTGRDKLEFLDRPMPEPAAGQVRIRTAACAICATDLLMIAGWSRTPFGSIPGHEWSGVVDAAGAGVDGKLVGRKCVAENVLRDGKEVGFENPGGYGQYFVTDAANVRTLPGDFDMGAATMIEPLAVCVRGLARLRPDAKGPTLIFGDGPIGLLTVMLLTMQGRKDLLVVGGRDTRLKLCQELGASRTVNYHAAGADLVAAIRRAAGEAGLKSFATVIEASGSGTAMDACIELAGPLARVLVIGDYGPARAGFEWNTVLHKELEVIGSNASAGGWDGAVAMAASGKLPLARMVSHRLGAKDFAQGIDLMRSRHGDVIKVVLEW